MKRDEEGELIYIIARGNSVIDYVMVNDKFEKKGGDLKW